MTERRKKPRRSILAGAESEPRGMRPLMAQYLEWLRVHAFADRSVTTHEVNLAGFAAWCEERGIRRPQEVTKPVVERFQRHLFHYRKTNGRPLGVTTQHNRLTSVRGFFKWCARENHTLFNPASEIEMPRLAKRLPITLTLAEVEAVLAKPDLEDPLGIRDRAVMETLWSTAMRRKELASLAAFDLNPERGTVMVRRGKGQKDRVVPIGERALRWIDKYLVDVRPGLVVEPDDGTLFLSATGQPFHPDELSHGVGQYVKAAGVTKPGACHLFRSTAATQMLEGGADIRFVQELLGHANLTTTQVYTHVSIEKLKQVHAATHPAAKPSAKARDAGDEEKPGEADILEAVAAESDEDPEPTGAVTP